MGLFNRHKQEPIKEVIIESVEKEEAPVVEEPKYVIRFDLPLDVTKRRLLVDTLYSKILKICEKIRVEYYTCNMFGLAVLKTNPEIDYFAALSHKMDSLEDRVRDNIDKYEMNMLNDLDDLYKLYEMFFDTYSALEEYFKNLQELRKDKYSKILISSIAPLINKKSNELMDIDKRLFDFLCDYKSLDDAADDIFMNSGTLIVNMINELCSFIESTKDEKIISTYNFNYFLDSEVVLALNTNEWVTLYNKVTYALKKLKGAEISHYIKTMKYFNDFEIRYLILMIQFEGKRN